MAKAVSIFLIISQVVSFLSLNVRAQQLNWTWLGGQQQVNQFGIYSGGVGVMPGSRQGQTSVLNSATNQMLLYGGYGYAASGLDGYLSDLWIFTISDGRWQFVGGSTATNALGSYVQPTWPGSRCNHSAVWDVKNRVMWMMAGYGYTTTTTLGYLNDVWQFNATDGKWSFVSGSTGLNTAGIYTVGASAAPGGRAYAQLVIDNQRSILYLYGGYGYSNVGGGWLGEIWSFAISTKLWNIITGGGVNLLAQYNSAPYSPGSRGSMGAAFDSKNQLLYAVGGIGVSTYGRAGLLKDLWLFNITSASWSFIGGSVTPENSGSNSWPSARRDLSLLFDDVTSNLYLIGGFGLGKQVVGSSILDRAYPLTAADLDNTPLGEYSSSTVYSPVSSIIDDSDGSWWDPSSGYIRNPYRVTFQIEPSGPQIVKIRILPADVIHSPTGATLYSDTGKTSTLVSAGAFSADSIFTVGVSYSGRSFYGEFGKTTPWQLWLSEVQFLSYWYKGPLIDVWKFNTRTKQWSQIDSDNRINRTAVFYGSSSTPGGRSGQTAFWDSLGSRILVHGGRGYASNMTQGYLSDVWSFNTKCTSGNYFNTADETCSICPMDTYCDGVTATKCMNNSRTLSTGSQTESDCICNAGFVKLSSQCQISPNVNGQASATVINSQTPSSNMNNTTSPPIINLNNPISPPINNTANSSAPSLNSNNNQQSPPNDSMNNQQSPPNNMTNPDPSPNNINNEATSPSTNDSSTTTIDQPAQPKKSAPASPNIFTVIFSSPSYAAYFVLVVGTIFVIIVVIILVLVGQWQSRKTPANDSESPSATTTHLGYTQNSTTAETDTAYSSMTTESSLPTTTTVHSTVVSSQPSPTIFVASHHQRHATTRRSSLTANRTLRSVNNRNQ